MLAYNTLRVGIERCSMTVCQYFGQTGCTAPTFGGDPTKHVNFVQHYLLGTSRIAEILNIPLIVIGGSLFIWFIVLPLVRAILDVLDFRHLQDRRLVFLELTPPSYSTKTSLATTELFDMIHGLLSSLTHKERWLNQKHVLPLEIYGTRETGICFRAALAPQDVELFQQLITSYLPHIQFREVADYITEQLNGQDFRILEFTQSNHFAYRLASQENLEQHDPMEYVTRALSKLESGELSAIQLVLSPASPRAANRVRSQLLRGQDKGLRRQWWHYPFILVWWCFKAVFVIFESVLEMISDEVAGIRTPRYKQEEAYRKHYGYSGVNPINAPVMTTTHAKLAEQLFNVDMRALVIGPDCNQRAQGLANALYTFHVPGFQGLHIRKAWLFRKRRLKHRLDSFHKRLPSMLTHNSSVLSASEVAALYHFPYGEHIQSEDMVKSLSQTLPAPLAMKQHSDAADYDVMLGVNKHHGSNTVIGLTAKEREKHVFLVGGTGNGKTTMLEYALLQDINAGKGVAFIDPHGDAAQKLLRYIPKKRIKDVIYLNPRDIKYPIGLNLLELPADLDEDELLVEKERVTEAVVSVLRKVFADDDANAHRIEAMLRNTIRTAFSTEQPTLFTCLELLRNSEYRNKVVAKLTDPHLKSFWKEEFGKAGGMQRVSMTKGLTHRLDRFESSEFVKRMMGQKQSTINFEDIIDSGKILICNFSTNMGEDTSTLFGTTVLAKLKIAAERRSEQPETSRKPFYVYVDEFQNFATTPFVKMLSSSRKYKLYLNIAEQSTAQQEEQRLTEAILANVSTIVCFGLGSPADERLLLSRFEPQLKSGNLLNQPAYNFYVRVKAEEPMEPVSGETIVLPPAQASEEQAKVVIEASRENYAIEWTLASSKTKDRTDEVKTVDKKDHAESEFTPQTEALEA
jgi:hypothetical protein